MPHLSSDDTPRALRCAVLGDPIAHSLSPVLHRAGYDVVGLPWTYDARRVAGGGLPGFLDDVVGAAPGSWRGLSLTMPLKREAMALADRVSDRARRAGAANTLVLAEGAVHADNTDTPGAVAALRERWDGEVTRATVLGAGATAASTGLALCDAGAREVRLLARSAERAAETVAAVAGHPSRPRVEVGSLDETPRGEVLVSTLPATAQSVDLVARCGEVPVVFEVLYDPWPTPLAAAVGADRVLVGGLDLLVHQAAVQFEIFTGTPAPLAAMRAAGERELAARGGRGDAS